MQRVRILFLITTTLFIFNSSHSQDAKDIGLEAITKKAVQGQLEFLASDWTEGRETGTKGIYLAGDYIASMFKYSGVAGAGDMDRANFRRMRRGGPRPVPTKSYFQNFSLVETLPGEPSKFVVNKGAQKIIFQDNVDFRLIANASSESSGQIVFVGYGIKSDKYGIDEIGTADLKGKIILRLSGYPGQGDPESKLGKIFAEDRMAGYYFSREKNNILEEKGALAVIDVSPGIDIGSSLGEFVDDMNMSPNESSRNSAFTRLSLYKEDASQGMVNLSVTQKVLNTILEGSGLNLEKYAKDAKGASKFKPVFIKNTSASIITDVKSRRVKVRNVVAMIEGEKTDEFIVVGAHMDHMGMSGGRIWNGADDNASGAVGVMTIARAFASTGVKPQRSVIFCTWTGEEKGLLGSTYWANNPSFGSIDQCKFYLNFDMISRDATNDTDKVNVGVTFNKNYPKLEEISKKNAEDYGLKMNFQYGGQDKPTGGSDFTAFTDNGVPIIAVMAAMHPEYHTPADQIELINWDKMLEIVKLGFLNMWDIANSDF